MCEGVLGVQLWNLGFQKREQEEKWTVYYYQHPQIWKPNNSSVTCVIYCFNCNSWECTEVSITTSLYSKSQGYRNKYNLINCGGNKKTFMWVENMSLIKQKLPFCHTRNQFKFLEEFSELIKNLSDVPKSETFGYFTKKKYFYLVY